MERAYHYRRFELDVLYILNMPEKYVTEDIIRKLYNDDDCHLRFIDEYAIQTIITYEICKDAVMRNPKHIYNIPSRFYSKELYEYVVRKNGMLLGHIPYNEITSDLAEIAVTCIGFALKHVPQRLLTKKLCEIAVENDFYPCYKSQSNESLNFLHTNSTDSVLKYVPMEWRDEEMCKKAIANKMTAIQYIPPQFSHLFKLKDTSKIKYIQPSFGECPNMDEPLYKMKDEDKTEEMCIKNVRGNYDDLRHIPERLKTVNVYIKLVAENRHNIVFVPKEMRTEEFYYGVIRDSYVGIDVYNFVPEEIITEDFLIKLMHCNKLQYKIPKKYQTKTLMLECVKQSKNIMFYKIPYYYYYRYSDIVKTISKRHLLNYYYRKCPFTFSDICHSALLPAVVILFLKN